MKTISDDAVRAVLLDCTEGSDHERITFGEVVMKLMGAGVERYRADMVRNERVYFMPNGESLVLPAHEVGGEPAQVFSAAGVDAAVRAIQAGQIKYQEFCRRIVAAGCVDYVVSLVGQRAIYFGRSGESHVEPFPGPQ